MQVAEVKIWGRVVGTVTWDAEKGYASFEYNRGFRELGWELAPLKMPVARGRDTFSFRELRRKCYSVHETFKGLPGLFADALPDALPDAYGNRLIQMWLAQQGRAVGSVNPVEMLCFMGTRGMGALEFAPAVFSEKKCAFSLEIDSLVAFAQKLLSQREAFSTRFKKGEKQAFLEILKSGTSAGGARPKAVIAWNEKSGEAKPGHTTAPKGFDHWLIKLDGVSDVPKRRSCGYGRVEMAYYLMARACGIEMMPSRLLEENGRAHFMTRRFDREGAKAKHHVQTFCALKHFDYQQVGNYSYEDLFQCMRELQLTKADAEQMFRRMVFNVFAHNCNDHTKKFAFLLKEEGRWQLAPAYDLYHNYRPGSPWLSLHALSINGKRSNIARRDLLSVSQMIGCKKAPEIIDAIADTVHRWKEFADQVQVDSTLRDEIGKSLLHK